MIGRAAFAGVLAACLGAGCGVRAPSPIDVAALVRRHGAEDARHELELRVVKDPGDVAARLALAKLSEAQHRPGAAIEQLEAVRITGGPIGTRWHADDRARLARLLHARGQARIARAAPTALRDLERARELGAAVAPADLARAQLARAATELQHVDAEERTRGLRHLGELARAPGADPAWRGALANATAAARGELGRWLWSVGARRTAWEELAAWHAATRAPRAEPLHAAYLLARAWWSPADAAAPPPGDLVGVERCRFRDAGCKAAEVAELDDAAIAAVVAAPPVKTSDPAEAMGWLAITLRGALRGDGAWGPSFRGRVELAAIPVERMPAAGRGAFARLTGRELRDERLPAQTSAQTPAHTTAETPAARLVVAATAALRGASLDEVRALLGPLAGTPDGFAILAIVAVEPADVVLDARRQAVAHHVDARVPRAPAALARDSDRPPQISRARLIALLDAYARDPASADRVARDIVAEASDAAAAHAWLGTVFDALVDPARARAAWQAAVDASPEPGFLRGLAIAIARAGDPDAALVIGTGAAAASGDPAPVWIELARTLHGTAANVHALEAARSAIDLASSATLGDALDVAIAASEAMRRVAQADGLRARRATLAPPPPPRTGDPTDPTDPVGAIEAYRASPSPETTTALWRTSRWNPRDVAIRAVLLEALATDDWRRRNVQAELALLAGDRDLERAHAALRVLR